MEEVRKLHNNAKRGLISACASGRVLDVGCGRGGDLKKYKHCHEVSSVSMWDPDKELLDEARQRALSLNITNVSFGHGDIMLVPEEIFDCICFNFSLHYIFKNKKLFQESILKISKLLRVGGKLFGCIPDSLKILTMTPMEDEYGNSFVRKLEQTGNGTFGEKLFVKMDSPFYNDEYIAEPIAYKDYLVDELSKYSINLLEWKPLIQGTNVPLVSKLYSTFIFVRE